MLEENTFGNSDRYLDSILEGFLYLTSKPISLEKLSMAVQRDAEQVEQAIKRIQAKYGQRNDPFIIEHSINENPEKSTVNLMLHENALSKLALYDLTASHELPKRFYRYMSIIMHLEYVKNQGIDREILKKALKMDNQDLTKIVKVLKRHGYLKQSKKLYTTSDRFLREMGLPTDRDSVKEVLKEKTIEYALQYFGFEDE